MSELRQDPFSKRWVVIAKERIERPLRLPRQLETSDDCPFCPGHEHLQPQELLRHIDPTGKYPYRVRVFPNQIPALHVEGDIDRRAAGVFDQMNGIGAHEVIVESADHARGLAELSIDEVTGLFIAIRERVYDLKRDTRFRHFAIWKNHGLESGAKWSHGHFQLLALPVIPPALAARIDNSAAHYAQKERCLMCDILRQERSEKVRVVADFGGAVVITPFAPQTPFHVWIAPTHHTAAFERSSDDQLRILSHALSAALSRLNHVLENPSFQLVLHTAPVTHTDSLELHYFLELVPTLFAVTAVDRALGVSVIDTSPEESARWLREASDR